MKVMMATPADFAWIQGRTSCGITSEARAIKAVDASGRIRGMVLFDCWTESAAQAHMAVDSPIVWRSLLPAAAWAIFEEFGRSILLGLVPAHNAKSCSLAKSFGFREAYRIPSGWAPGDDLCIFELRRDECRFLQRNRKAA